MDAKKVDTMVRFSPLEIPFIIKTHWKSEPKCPVHFTAAPSTVKSEGTLQAAKVIAEQEGREFFEWNRKSMEEKKAMLDEPKRYFLFADIRASETDIGELRLQDMKNGEEFISFKYNILFRAASNKDAVGILFFDEMNLAPNMIKAQFYKIINDRAIGDIPISDGILCVSAGNEAEHARGVTEDPVPLVLRRANYFLRPLSADEYREFAVAQGQHQFIIGFLGFQPQFTHKVEYDLPDGVGQPCPRTWTKLSSMLRNNPKLSLDHIEMVATGLIGQGVARQFKEYVKSAQGIDIDQLLREPKRIEEFEKMESMSLFHAILSGVVEKWREDKKVIVPALEMSLYIRRVELGTFFLRAVKAADVNKFTKALVDDKIVKDLTLVDKVAEKYGKYLFGA